MKKLILFTTLAFLTAILFQSCKKEGCTDPQAKNYDKKAKKDDGSCEFASACENTAYTYLTDIKPIIDGNCIGCHQPGGLGYGGAQLDTYEGVKAAATTGKMLDAINHRPGARPMPDGAPKLSSDLIKKIECWVEKGTPE